MKPTSAQAVAMLGALAQETRLAIYRLLVEAGPAGMIVGAIGEALDVPAATLSFHLRTLTQAALLTLQQEGRCIRYRADFTAMGGLLGFLTDDCCGGNPAACAIPAPEKKA